MARPEIIDLGMIDVDFGRQGDPERIKSVFGDFPSDIDFAPEAFLTLNEDREGLIRIKLGIALYHVPYGALNGFHRSVDRLRADGIVSLAGIFHLASIARRRHEIDEQLRSKDIRHIYISDPTSLWWNARRRTEWKDKTRVLPGNEACPYLDLELDRISEIWAFHEPFKAGFLIELN